MSRYLGRKVTFSYAGQSLKGVVVQDKGPIGYNRRHLLRIRISSDEQSGISRSTSRFVEVEASRVNLTR